jgi:hypothetical protein
MGKEIYVQFVNDGNSIKGIDESTQYTISHLDDVKKAIDLDLSGREIERVEKSYHLFINGKKQLQGKMLFGKDYSLSFEALVTKTVTSIPGISDQERNEFLNEFSEALKVEKELFNDEYFRGFSSMFDQEFTDKDFSLRELSRIFELVSKLFRPTSELDKMIRYIGSCFKDYAEDQQSSFEDLLNFIDVYGQSLKLSELDLTYKKHEGYTQFSNTINHPDIDIMVGIPIQNNLNKMISEKAFNHLKSGNELTETSLFKIVDLEIEQAVGTLYKKVSVSKEVKAILDPLGGYLNNELEDVVEMKEELYKDDKPLVMQPSNDEVMDALTLLAKQGKIQNILSLTDQERDMVNAAVLKKREDITSDQMIQLVKTTSLPPKLVTYLFDDKNTYKRSEETKILEDVSEGEFDNVFFGSDGKAVTMYEELKEAVNAYLLSYDEATVNERLRKAYLEECDLTEFKVWAVEVYLQKYVSPTLLVALKG